MTQQSKIGNMTSLLECKESDIKWFDLNGICCECKVLSIYDADTITVAFQWDDHILYKVKCRLYGIDTPEKRTKNKEEKRVALLARQWLCDRILNKIIWIKFGKWGKYGGRCISTIYKNAIDAKNDKSINQTLVECGYAYEYYGKKKRDFNDWYSGYNQDVDIQDYSSNLTPRHPSPNLTPEEPSKRKVSIYKKIKKAISFS